jgi:hypothetical protein
MRVCAACLKSFSSADVVIHEDLSIYRSSHLGWFRSSEELIRAGIMKPRPLKKVSNSVPSTSSCNGEQSAD